MQNNTGKALYKADTFYVSGRIHTVLLKDLEPNTTYYYRKEACMRRGRSSCILTHPDHKPPLLLEATPYCRFDHLALCSYCGPL